MGELISIQHYFRSIADNSADCFRAVEKFTLASEQGVYFDFIDYTTDLRTSSHTSPEHCKEIVAEWISAISNLFHKNAYLRSAHPDAGHRRAGGW